MATVLSRETVNSLSESVKKPNYSAQDLTPGIVHIGVGNFHRAHQAMYMHELFQQGESHEWAIVGAGTKSFDVVMRDKLAPQDWLTTVVELDAQGLQAQVCGAMVNFIADDHQALIKYLCDPAIKIVSLTITEGGYYIDEKTGGFDLQHPEIQADIADFTAPKTVFGILLKALADRSYNGVMPFTVMSCDNIPHNGNVTKNALCTMAKAISEDLAQWVENYVTFPNSMVDCITPATSESEKARLVELFEMQDNAPVFCEPYRQWVLEDNFVNGRPALEKVGVEFVDDVAPFELMKLRILNGGHASIAYPAALLGIDFVHDVMANDLIAQYLTKLESEDIIPSLPPVPGVNFIDYLALIKSRFANPEVRDTVLRLCQDGSNRLPKFILPIINANIKSAQSYKGLALVVALWCRLCAESADQNSAFSLDDIQAKRLMSHAILAKNEPSIFLEMTDIFGDLGENAEFVELFTVWVNALWQHGVAATLKQYID